MPNEIQLLPDKIVNQIAAGEVIGRPASVVKELMENAIDAGATDISLIVKDAGKTLVQVVDDGCGMSQQDARICFERHATSKIREYSDLFNLNTMGFRGEALASVAAVAQVELTTRQQADETGTCLKIEGSAVVSEEECQWEKGTRISVKNLFFNVPARRSFLKSDAVETRHIIDEFLRIALSYPELSLSMHHNNTEVYHLRPANLRQRIVAVFGNHYNERLVPVEEDTDYVRVSGFIGKPDSAKRTRGEQYFFLNGRYIRNAYLNHAIYSAYGSLLAERSYPLYVLHIHIDPSAVDVNVHPTKHEVKFEDEKSVYMIVQAAVRHGLAQYSVTPSIDFDQEASFKDFEAFRTVFSSNVAEQEQVSAKGSASGGGPGDHVKPSTEGWQTAFTGTEGNSIVTLPSNWDEQQELPIREEEEAAFEPVQLHKTFILTQIKSGIILIHQNLAHQRILYERYLHSFDRNASCQQLLFPLTIRISGNDAVLLNEILSDIKLLGFDIQAGKTDGEHGEFTVHGVPADLVNENAEHLLENMIEQYKWNADHGNIPQRENIARSLARFTAIPAGRGLALQTMQALIDQLFGCSQPQLTAFGQPTYIQYSLEKLMEQFSVQ
jgi:DNA mismatch repair protein MutL